MTPERARLIEAILAEASRLPRQERSAFLDARCAGDASLRVAIEQRLREGAQDQETRTAGAGSPAIGTDVFSRIHGAMAQEVGRAVSAVTDRPDPWIGREIDRTYRILSRIGGGGMGVVYLAARTADFEKKVALKLVRPGLDSEEIVRRFHVERQTLADLEHPNIARLLDGGSTGGENPQPYLVMEYIDGTPITAYCEEHGLSVSERVKLFEPVCTAVQFAHSMGVIHRDLKPANILVGQDGVPRLVDFGIAKLMSAAPTASNDDASGDSRTLTKDYASPEQFRGAGIGMASDVYSLGVVLYELLTGVLPYPEVKRAGREDAERIVREVPPPAPSEWIRGFEPELEAILLHALEKKAEKRYPSAEALRVDLRAYLDDRPISLDRGRWPRLALAHARSLGRRRPLPARAAITLGVAAVAHFVVTSFVFQPWFGLETTPDHYFRRWMTSTVAGQDVTMDTVRMVGLTDKTNIDEIAEAELLEGVSATNPKSLRRLHGRALERLVGSGVRAVALDIFFRAPTEFDADLIRGIRALRSDGVDVVGLVSWETDDRGLPVLTTPEILSEVLYGSGKGTFESSGPWSIELALVRQNNEPRPSLALTTFAACRRPHTRFLITAETTGPMLRLYWQSDTVSQDPRPNLNPPDIVNFTQWTAPSPQMVEASPGEYQPKDLIARYCVPLPTPERLAESTIEYGDIFTADKAALTRWFRGRVAVFFDGRPGIDRHPTPDGRVLPGAVSHAAAIDVLLNDCDTTTPLEGAEFGLTVIGALAGTMCMWVFGARTAKWLPPMLFLTVAFAGASLMAYQLERFLCNPTIPILAAWMACLLSRPLQRRRAVG